MGFREIKNHDHRWGLEFQKLPKRLLKQYGACIKVEAVEWAEVKKFDDRL